VQELLQVDRGPMGRPSLGLYCNCSETIMVMSISLSDLGHHLKVHVFFRSHDVSVLSSPEHWFDDGYACILHFGFPF